MIMACMCAWCRKIRLNGMWVHVNFVTGSISHGICPDCAIKFKQGDTIASFQNEVQPQ